MNLHLELTNRCVLRCPACPRTQWHDLLKKPVPRNDLDFHDLHRFLDCSTGKKVDKFLLCGDYGDAIYYPKLFDFLNWFRSTKKYWIHTNGSHQPERFWHQLSELLTKDDHITFAIDGLAATNSIYRINSNWNSIMRAVDIMTNGSAKVHWKTIVFGYNYTDLEKIKQLALDKGCTFTAEKTHRYGNDSLIPPADFVEQNHVYQDQFSHDHTIEIEPSCLDTKTVGCDGILYPCDWIRNPRTFYKSLLWRQKDRWLSKLNIRDTDLDAALLVVQDWANHVRESSLKQLDTVDVLCRMKCRKGCKQIKTLEI